MKRILYLGMIISLFIAGCSTTQNITQPKVTGDDYINQGEFAKALLYFENEISTAESQNLNAKGETYCKAGISAYKISNIDKAIKYFKRAIYLKSETEEMMELQIASYKSINNLSNEIEAIEHYLDKFPQAAQADVMKARLFETCLESENWDQAESLWTGFGEEAMTDARLLDIYLRLSIAQKKEDQSDDLAAKLLKLDGNNLVALKLMGEKFFWKAENRYQEETKAYQKKRTRSQYAKLLKALDIVTADFKTSLKYFKKLYEIKPDKKVAKFLGNIYARLDDKENSTYYKNRAR